MRAHELFEAISLSQARPFMRANNSAQYDDLFARFTKYSRGNPKLQRLYFPLRTSGDTSQEDFSTAVELLTFFKEDANLDSSWFSEEVKMKLKEIFRTTISTIADLKNINFSKFDERVKECCRDYQNGYIRTSVNGKYRLVRIGKFFEQLTKAWTQAASLFQSYIERDGESVKTIDKGLVNNRVYREVTTNILNEIKKNLAVFQIDPVRCP